MNGLDAVLIVVAGAAVVGGWRLGLVTRGLGWVGALIGGAIGVFAVPALNRWIEPSSDGGVLLLTAGSFILLISFGQAIGVAVGSRMRPRPEAGGVHRVDAVGGSLLGVIGVVALIWLLAPLAASTTVCPLRARKRPSRSLTLASLSTSRMRASVMGCLLGPGAQVMR